MRPEDSGQAPEASLVICTRNRLPSLKRSVEATLAIETTRKWELIVVDNGSSDGTSDYLRDLRASTGRQLLTVYQPRPGLGRARNSGWRAARAPIIAFTDDDCYVTSDYVDAVISAFESDPSIAAIGGALLLYDPSDLNICVIGVHRAPRHSPLSVRSGGACAGVEHGISTRLLSGDRWL